MGAHKSSDVPGSGVMGKAMGKSSFELRHVGILYRAGRSNQERQGILIDRLSIPDAGITAIVGASASGKSTLLNVRRLWFLFEDISVRELPHKQIPRQDSDSGSG